MTEKESLIILNAVPGLGNIGIRKLVKYFGSARKLLMLPLKELPIKKIISYKIIESISSFNKEEFLRNELNTICASKIRVITYQDECYPENLRYIPDAPVVLYVKGALETVGAPAVAVVGSRKSSIYGLNIAEKLSADLAVRGITVVSGLARGIDTAAHRGVLKVKGKTAAVLGCGLSRVYPPENKKLYDSIGESGLLVSEFPMDMPPLAVNFPRRNRVISGLSNGVVIVEAAKKSGALITADYALEQGREVFAVPGNIDNPYGFGSNNLIKQGAKVVTCVEDILEELSLPNDQKQVVNARNLERLGLSIDESKILKIVDESPIHIDALAALSRCTHSSVMSSLLSLELKGLIKQLPGKIFVADNHNIEQLCNSN